MNMLEVPLQTKMVNSTWLVLLIHRTVILLYFQGPGVWTTVSVVVKRALPLV